MHGKKTASILCCVLLMACSARETDVGSEPRRIVPEGATAPLFNDLSDHSYPVSTSSPLAQKYFGQGLMLTYGFNHADAARSFREAQRLDPSSAICFWGEAYVLGANINKPMEASDAPRRNEPTGRSSSTCLAAGGRSTASRRAFALRTRAPGPKSCRSSRRSRGHAPTCPSPARCSE